MSALLCGCRFFLFSLLPLLHALYHKCVFDWFFKWILYKKRSRGIGQPAWRMWHPFWEETGDVQASMRQSSGGWFRFVGVSAWVPFSTVTLSVGWQDGHLTCIMCIPVIHKGVCVCVCVCVFVEEKFIVDGWDSSFTTDVTLLRHNSSMSTAELLTGFFQFYAQFDFRSFVLCPRLGHAIDVAEFIDRQQSDSRLQHFKVCLKPNWHEAVSVLQFLPCNAMRARYMLSSCVCLSVCLSLCHKSVFCEDC